MALGSCAMVGDLLRIPELKGIGVASVAAPLPKVFSSVDGWETFAAEFVLLLGPADGNAEEVVLDPRLAKRLRGPYNRRNVYGAALSYAPRLPQTIWEPVFCHGFGPSGTLRGELGLPPEVPIRVRLRSKTSGREEEIDLAPECGS